MSAIEPYRPAPLAGTFRYATTDVLADVRIVGVERRRHCVTYEMAVVNRKDQPVRARLMGYVGNGKTPRELGSIEVAADSAGRARIIVPLPRRGGELERVHVQLDGDNLLFVGEAPAPTLRHRPGAAVGLTLVACGILSILATAATLLIPQTPAVASPATVVDGTVTHIGYATMGYGQRDYSVWAADGTVLASALLPQSRGDFSFAVPPHSAPTSLHVLVRVSGLLGNRQREITLPVVAAAAPTVEKVARIVSLSAHRGPDAFGRDSVVISYLAVGDGGIVDLTDPAGRIVASAPFAHTGTNRLVLARGWAAQPLVARVAVRRDLTRATAAVELPPSILIDGQPLEPSGQGGPVTPADAPFDTQAPEAVTPLESASDGLVAIEGRAVAGRTLSLRLLARMRSLHVELQGEQGQPLVANDVAPDASRAVLPLPPATVRRTYYLVLRYVNADNAEETVVRSVIVRPA
jgi:hypothetical protein